MIKLSKKRYYILVFLLFLSVLYGYNKHSEVNNQRDYLNPQLTEMLHSFQNEAYITSVILYTLKSENEIPYAQWKQLKKGFKVLEQSSYEIEKMGRAIHPSRAKGLENATKNTSSLISSDLEYIEENFLEEDLDRLDIITFPPEAQSKLEHIYTTTSKWNEISSQYAVSTNSIKQTYWVKMMKEIQEPSIVFQHKYTDL
ncbi:hypothetical protein [Gracilibacillus massiliensis]|uniref:hypothetical protein n=1 Tax=Gracilibacillus massiliensis TaxID=1564956 RepID=UPI00071E1B0F|nr:hypothetical protein [Gracilibacillus massiliensis]